MRFLSLVIPVYQPPRRFLEELINSIACQIRSDVEVILSVDGPLRAQDEWVRPLGSETNRSSPQQIGSPVPRHATQIRHGGKYERALRGSIRI